jgi:hypothetical protein
MSAQGEPLRNRQKMPFNTLRKQKQKQKRRVARAAAKRQETYREIRKTHADNADGIRVGEGVWLEQTAKVYLGRFSEFDKDDTPEVRVETFLGADLTEDTLSGHCQINRTRLALGRR